MTQTLSGDNNVLDMLLFGRYQGEYDIWLDEKDVGKDFFMSNFVWEFDDSVNFKGDEEYRVGRLLKEE